MSHQEATRVRSLLVMNESAKPRRWAIPDGESAVGRSPGCDLVLDDPDASRKHAILVSTGNGVWVEDAGSVNGTSVNGIRITEPRRLSPDDLVRMGATTLLASADRGVRSTQRSTEDPSADPPKPWYKRTFTMVVGVGTIATAITAVIVLWGTLFPSDVEDFGEIASLENLGDTRLSEFSTDRLGSTVEMSPDASSAPTDGNSMVLAMSDTGRIAGADDTGPGEITETPPAPDAHDNGLHPSPQPTTVATAEPGAVPSPQPTTVATAEPGAVPSPQPTTVPTAEPGVVPTPDTGDGVGDDDQNVLREPTAGVTDSSSNPDTSTTSSDFAEAMRWVEPVAESQGSDYQGSTLAVGIAVEGLADKDLIVTWYLAGEGVSDIWREEKLAYTLHASTNRDHGSVVIWVPNLISPAPYQANVRLAHANGITIDEKALVFPADE